MATPIILIMMIVIIGGPLLYFIKYFEPSKTSIPIFKEDSDQESQKSDLNVANEKLLEIMYNRHYKAKKNAIVMLTFAIISLVTGVIFFYYASEVASTDRRRNDQAARSKITFDLEKSFLGKYADSMGINLDSLIEAKKIEDNYDRKVDNSNKKATDSLSKLRRKSNDLNQEEILKKTEEIYYSNRSHESTSNVESLYFLLTTISIRIIIAFLTFYLAKIFLNLYKYYVQISDFYINRFDAIVAFDEDKFKIDFKEITSLFEHKIKIGIGSKSPIDDAVDIANAFKK
jgi:hypothetical protein